jgi:hypothetical protein
MGSDNKFAGFGRLQPAAVSQTQQISAAACTVRRRNRFALNESQVAAKPSAIQWRIGFTAGDRCHSWLDVRPLVRKIEQLEEQLNGLPDGPEMRGGVKMPRFRLRTLSVAITVLGVVTGLGSFWYRSQRAEYDQQNEVAKAMKRNGAIAFWRSTSPKWLAYFIRFFSTDLGSGS